MPGNKKKTKKTQQEMASFQPLGYPSQPHPQQQQQFFQGQGQAYQVNYPVGAVNAAYHPNQPPSAYQVNQPPAIHDYEVLQPPAANESYEVIQPPAVGGSSLPPYYPYSAHQSQVLAAPNTSKPPMVAYTNVSGPTPQLPSVGQTGVSSTQMAAGADSGCCEGRSYLPFSIFTCVLCNLIIGAVAVFYSVKANKSYERGQAAEGANFRRLAKICCIVALLIGLLSWAGGIARIVLVELNGNGIGGNIGRTYTDATTTVDPFCYEKERKQYFKMYTDPYYGSLFTIYGSYYFSKTVSCD